MLCLTFAFPGNPSYSRRDTLVPLSNASTRAPSEEESSLPGERGLDLEDYNCQQGENDGVKL